MILVNLKGGLGNQMFQYATGRAIQIRESEKGNEQKLLLSTRSFEGHETRKYALDFFNIKAGLAEPEELSKIKYPFGIFSKAWRLVAGRYLGFFNTKKFNKKYTECNKNLFLDGFFQTEKYFKEFRKEISEDFKLKTPLKDEAENILEEIKSTENSVSIHFRRGDFVGNSTFDLQDDNYQNRAISKIKESLDSLTFFVFSDDINWVKENYNFNNKTVFVSNSKIKDYEELILMSNCENNIIPNSTFAWWAAWLNQNPNKMVIAPTKWANGEKDTEFSETVPESWIRV